MVSIITDPTLEEELIAKRRATGADRFDEVWEGVYVMTPLANDEHQDLVNQLTTVLTIVVDWAELGKVRPGVNVTDRQDDWTQNFRCPDVVVFLNNTKAENRDTHWFGGPDFAIEVISPHDRSREKLDFYTKVGTRELMLIDRDPWSLELYRLEADALKLIGKSLPDDSTILSSDVVPLSWQLVSAEKRPRIEVAHSDGEQRWTI